MPPETAPPEVVTVGHAIVDVLAETTDGQVGDLGVTKGQMTLVDQAESERIYGAVDAITQVSGGSAANTAVGLAALGARTAFVGKVADDPLGAVFAQDIRGAGVDYAVPPGSGGASTGRCVVLVTPDAEKTMCTNLGIGDLLGPEDVDAGLVAAAQVVYLEGYLCGLDTTDATVEAVLAAAESGGTTVALSLSDPFWVALHGADMDRLLERIGLLFANEEEACAMAGAGGAAEAGRRLAERVATVVVTRGAGGSLVVWGEGEGVVEVPATRVSRVVDTTGAGDMFAAGYLYGHLRGFGVERSARLGGVVAAEVVSHLGARPVQALRPLAAAAGLL
ncbi:MAG: adenosine kinase [Acidimicrobiales bacterium]